MQVEFTEQHLFVCVVMLQCLPHLRQYALSVAQGLRWVVDVVDADPLLALLIVCLVYDNRADISNPFFEAPSCLADLLVVAVQVGPTGPDRHLCRLS